MAATIACLFVCFNVFADVSFTDGQFRYRNWFGGGGLSAYCNDFTSSSFVLPATVTYQGVTYTVDELGWDAFEDCTNLEKLTVMSSWLNILSGSFKGCTNLREIWFPNISNDVRDVPGIGTPTWPCSIDDIFDNYHYSSVILYVKNEAAYRADVNGWAKFRDIRQLAQSISLDKAQKYMAVGGTFELNATVLPQNTFDQSVTWTSSNPSVASVNSSGVVTANSMGSAIITATTNDGTELTAPCNISVISGDVNGDGIIDASDISTLIEYLINL